MKLRFFAILLCLNFVTSQSDGGFWWLNRDLIKGAKESRELKNNNLRSRVRTLPQRYRDESTTAMTTAKPRNSIFGDYDEDEDDDREMFKFGNEPDCVCEVKELCDEKNYLITDGTGIIDERSSNLCGTGRVCCRIPKSSTSSYTKTPAIAPTTKTTRKPFFSLQNLISTVLKPVNSLDFNQQQESSSKCVSRKGKKIQERILIDEDYEEDDDEAVFGETNFAEYPWMVAILKKAKKTDNFEYKCGGVLISMKTSLTALHCLASTPSKVKLENFKVRAGEWDQGSSLEIIPHQDRLLSEIISHSNYYSGGLFNDIALLKWEKPFESEINVAPICLPDVRDNFEDKKIYCTVTGWGKVSDKEAKSDKLKFVKVPYVDRITCQRQLQKTRLGSRFRLHESFVCAGGEENRDSCDGDGGSPLVCPRTDGSFVLTGLVSWGIGCGQKNVPGVYTNIKNLINWIQIHSNK